MFSIPLSVQQILEKALSGIRPSRTELLELLAADPHSPAGDAVRMVGRQISRMRFGSRAMLLCQTGVELFPCPADCAFCSFAQSVYSGTSRKISLSTLGDINTQISRGTGVYAHFLLFMHTFDFEYMLRVVEQSRRQLPASVRVVLNCGDVTRTQLEELCSAGIDGAYHVLRLREGMDTRLTREERIRSIEAVKESGMDWYTCCEPVGPEHSNEELVDQILLAAEYECFQNAVMRRISVPGTKLLSRGQIDLVRSAQLTAVVAMAMLGNPALSSIAIHEPDLLGLTSGANCIYAEFGGNPRDTVENTECGRGSSIQQCRAMLKDCGYRSLMQAGEDAGIALE